MSQASILRVTVTTVLAVLVGIAALIALAFAPATAPAAGADPTPNIQGSPQIHILDRHHARISFDSGRLPRTKAGKLAATIAFANGARVSSVIVNRKYELLDRYMATASSSRVLRHHEQLRVTFRLGGSKPVTRTIDATSVRKPELGGAPRMTMIDEHHATLAFTADELPRTKAGKLDATIRFANGETVSGLKRTGRHGRDAVYGATITSPHIMSARQKFSITFRLCDSGVVARPATLYGPSA